MNTRTKLHMHMSWLAAAVLLFVCVQGTVGQVEATAGVLPQAAAAALPMLATPLPEQPAATVAATLGELEPSTLAASAGVPQAASVVEPESLPYADQASAYYGHVRAPRKRNGTHAHMFGAAFIAAATTPVCRWKNHCLGDPCKTYNDCDNNWICVNQKCAVPGGPTPPPPAPKPSPSPAPVPPPPGNSYKTTLTAYNVMSFDNTVPGDLYVGRVSQNFVNNVNIVAVHSKVWTTYAYTQVDITLNGRTGRFVVLDLCADKDCPSPPPGCCTINWNFGGNGFLLDVDSSAARRVWGISNAENTLLTSAIFKPVPNSKVDFAALQRRFP